MATKDEEVRRILIKFADRQDNQIIEIPKKWKVTFASVNPASGRDGYREGYCLRVYESGEKLVAVFDSVKSFRDMDIPLMREVKSEMGSSNWQKDSLGNFKETREVKVQTELVVENPTAINVDDEVEF